MRSVLIHVALISGAAAHGVIRTIEGANNVSMPGLAILDGTPRDCIPSGCGSQVDTAIIRDPEILNGRSALGWTLGGGDVDPAKVISTFMNSKSSGANNGGPVDSRSFGKRGGFWNFPGIGALGFGGNRHAWPKETIISDTAGQGATTGLPTTDDDGVISMVYRQINEDGAGPMTAAVDPSSGGYDYKAFETAKVVNNVPGVGFGGLSIATNTDYAVQVQLPQGMICNGKVGGAENVCIVRVRNQAFAGPFGGSGAFTQSETARKRASALGLKRRSDRN